MTNVSTSYRIGKRGAGCGFQNDLKPNREAELACRAIAPRRRKRPSRVACSDLLDHKCLYSLSLSTGLLGGFTVSMSYVGG
jgi:hypothetical protein